MLTPYSWDWTAEQHEAAAAALGTAAARIARTTAALGHAWRHGDMAGPNESATGILIAASQDAHTLAQDAASHAFAAEREREAQAAWIAAQAGAKELEP